MPPRNAVNGSWPIIAVCMAAMKSPPSRASAVNPRIWRLSVSTIAFRNPCVSSTSAARATLLIGNMATWRVPLSLQASGSVETWRLSWASAHDRAARPVPRHARTDAKYGRIPGEAEKKRAGPLLAIGGGGEELNVFALFPVDCADDHRQVDARDSVSSRLWLESGPASNSFESAISVGSREKKGDCLRWCL